MARRSTRSPRRSSPIAHLKALGMPVPAHLRRGAKDRTPRESYGPTVESESTHDPVRIAEDEVQRLVNLIEALSKRSIWYGDSDESEHVLNDVREELAIAIAMAAAAISERNASEMDLAA